MGGLASDSPVAAERRFYGRIGAHLTTAFRLRRRLDHHRTQRETQKPEAIFDDWGKVVHLEGDAKEPVLQQALRAAVVATDRARGQLRETDPERALALWHSMVQARWSLLDRFEYEGRRYYVAFANDPVSRNLTPLAPQERLVAEYVALGHSNKFIAYELGLSTASVATYLKRTIAKLGLGSRLELIAFLRSR